jgi:hypothetical protein
MPFPANRRLAKPHARIYAHWRELPAWRVLSCAARCLLVEMLMEYRPGRNGQLQFSVRRAAAIARVGKQSAVTALAELEKAGWITVQKLGALRGGNAPTEFALTLYDNDVTGEEASRAFERWQPSAPAIRARAARVRPEGRELAVSGTRLSDLKDANAKREEPLHISDALKKSLARGHFQA